MSRMENKKTRNLLLEKRADWNVCKEIQPLTNLMGRVREKKYSMCYNHALTFLKNTQHES